MSELQGKHKRLEARLKLVREESEQEKAALEQEIKVLKEETETLKGENEKLVVKNTEQVKKVAFVTEASPTPTPPATPAPVVPVAQTNAMSNAEVYFLFCWNCHVVFVIVDFDVRCEVFFQLSCNLPSELNHPSDRSSHQGRSTESSNRTDDKVQERK